MQTDTGVKTISGEESTQAGVHFCAGVEMMKLRKPEHKDTMTGRIFHFMRLELAVRNLCSLRNLATLEPVVPFSSLYTMRSFSDLVLQAETACLELWTAAQAYDPDAVTESKLQHVEVKMHQVLQVLRNISKFELTVESDWKYKTIRGSIPTRSPPLPESNGVMVFLDVQLGAQWMALWCAHVRLIDTLAAGLAISGDTPLRSTAAQQIQEGTSTSEKIYATVPFMLGEVDSDGYPRKLGEVAVGPAPMILAPVLYIAGTSFSARKEQKLWICDRLAQIGHQRGIGQALVFEKQLRKTIEL